MKKICMLIACFLMLSGCDLDGILPPIGELNNPEPEIITEQIDQDEPVEYNAPQGPENQIYNFMDGLLVDSDENACISPLSFKLALAMAYNGAQGDAAETLAAMFDVSPITMNAWAADFLARAKGYDGKKGNESTPPTPELLIANSYWMRSGNERYISSDFSDAASANYNAKKGTFVRIPDPINDWVSGATKSKIDDIIEEIDTYALLYLINALYFRGNWISEFDKGDMEPCEFTNIDGEKVEKSMLIGSADAYIEEPGLAGVTKNLHGGFTFTAVMPESNAAVPLERIIAAMEAADESYTSIILTIPKFAFETTIDFREGNQPEFDALFAINGMDGALAENAKLDYLFISGIFHKTRVAFAEKGIDTTTAAVYVAEPSGAIAPEPKEIGIVFNRPFYFVLTDKNGEAILFGKVTQL